MGRADCQNTTYGEGLPGARHCADGPQRSGPPQRTSDAADRQPPGNGAHHCAGGVERDDLGAETRQEVDRVGLAIREFHGVA